MQTFFKTDEVIDLLKKGEHLYSNGLKFFMHNSIVYKQASKHTYKPIRLSELKDTRFTYFIAKPKPSQRISL